VALRGGVAFDKEDHPAALRKLSVARLLFTALADAAAESKQAALANSWVDQSDAQLRFSAYQLELGDGSPDEIVSAAAPADVCEAEVPGFAALIQELEALRGERKVRASVTITWREEVIPVRNAELVDALARVHAAEQALGKAVDAHDEDAQRKTADAPAKGHKRQRLTSAQRTAKKRASAGGAPGTDGAAAVGISATGGRTQLDPYDRALGALSDAEELARRLVEDNAAALAKSHSTRYEAAGKDLQRAHEYLQYRLLSLRVRRNAHLVEEVNHKAARREQRARDALERRLASGSQSEPRKRKEGVEPKRLRAPKPKRKNGPGARAKRPRTAPRAYKRKPARSGARKARAQRAASKEQRARSVEAEKQRRRAARAVPGVAKLLDGAEASLSAMAALGLVEAQPDVSSLIDAKAAWYKAEVLRILARAYDLGGAQDHALLLLARAQLFVRQARQAAELVDDAGEEDADAPPRMLESTFAQTEQLVEAAQKDAQRELYFSQHGLGREASSSANLINSAASRSRSAGASSSKGLQRGTAQRDTKAGQAVRDLATKHVTFDADDLAHAAHLSDSREAELQQELRAAVAEKQQAQSSKAAAAAKKAAPTAAKPQAPATPAAAAKPAPAAKEAAPKAAAPAAKSIPEAVVETVQPPLAAAAQAVQPPLQAAAQAASAAVEQVTGGGEPYDPGNVTDEEEEEQRAAQTPKKGWLGGWFGGR
jgi:signal recognition particle subunit SRP68